MLTITHLTKKFEKTVLDDLSCTIPEHSIYGLVGVNGAGKTTLLRCIAGIYQRDEGQVLFEGRDTYLEPSVRSDIFFINDDPFFPYASTMRTLKQFYEEFYTLDEEINTKYLNLFELDVYKQISSFSKGMKRQMMLCFAFAARPKLLILDEAFDGLDPLVRVHIKKGLSDLMEEEGSTIIISSHNLRELEDICDSYGILQHGRITTYGDLLESKEMLHKYQVAFTSPLDEEAFDGFDILYRKKEGSVYTLVIRGEREEIVSRLEALDPVILDVLNVSFEELFIYEHEGGLS